MVSNNDKILKMNMAGLSKDNVKVMYQNNYITCEGSKDDIKYKYMGYVSDNYDSNNIKATLDNGLLIVTIPKKEGKLIEVT